MSFSKDSYLKMSDVIIIGGGISGLSVAHELRRRSYRGNILILERNNKIGGQARSDSLGNGFWTEYSWRIYGPAYRTLRRIMTEIPALTQADNKEDKRVVYDHLVDIRNNLLATNHASNITLNYALS